MLYFLCCIFCVIILRVVFSHVVRVVSSCCINVLYAWFVNVLFEISVPIIRIYVPLFITLTFSFPLFWNYFWVIRILRFAGIIKFFLYYPDICEYFSHFNFSACTFPIHVSASLAPPVLPLNIGLLCSFIVELVRRNCSRLLSSYFYKFLSYLLITASDVGFYWMASFWNI